MQVWYCKGRYLSVTPVDQLQRQLGVRFFSTLYYTRPHSTEPPFFKEGVNFNISLGGEEFEKSKKGQKYGAGLLKKWRLALFHLIFSSFIFFTLRNYFTLCKIVLYIWRKKVSRLLWEKSHSKLSNNEPVWQGVDALKRRGEGGGGLGTSYDSQARSWYISQEKQTVYKLI